MSNIILDQMSFEQQLDEIHQHFVTALSSRKFTKLVVDSFPPIRLDGNGQEEIQQAADEAESESEYLISDQKKNLDEACEEYNKDINYNFEERVDEIYDYGDAKYLEISQKNRNKMKELGKKYPDRQEEIIHIAKKETNFWISTFETFSNFISTLVAKVHAWVATAAKWINKAIEDIADWAKHSFSKTVDFFKRIFH